MLKLLILLGSAITFIVVAMRTSRGQQSIAAADASGACIACGSPLVERSDDIARCKSCGYEGRADGGGKLDPEDIAEIFKK